MLLGLPAGLSEVLGAGKELRSVWHLQRLTGTQSSKIGDYSINCLMNELING